jgi:hypothetical protein
MVEYRASGEKNGIRVEMVVSVNSKVNVNFLVSSNRSSPCYTLLSYYDSLGNKKTVYAYLNVGEVNKNVDVISFNKPSSNFNACFDIV